MLMYKSDPPLGDSYARWVRAVLQSARAHRSTLVPLFESSVPEPTHLLRPLIADAFSDPISDRYVSAFNGGNPYVAKAVAARYGVREEDVLGSAGATNGISLVYRALLSPGDHVLIESPGFDLFGEVAARRSARIDYFVRKGQQATLDVDALKAAIRPETRLIVLSDLHNPTSAKLDGDDVAELIRVAEQRGIYLLVDEVYADHAAPGGAAPAALLSPMVISVSGLTKNFGLSTLRCGWVIAAPPAMALIRAVADRSEVLISNMAHAVAALVLENPAPFDAHARDILTQARPVVTRYMDELLRDELVDGDVPPQGCIMFPRLIGIDDDCAFAQELQQRTGVIVAPGSFFGASGHVRLGMGLTPERLEEGLARLADQLRRVRRSMPTTNVA